MALLVRNEPYSIGELVSYPDNNFSRVKRDAIFRFNSGMDEDIPYSYSPEPPLSMPHDEPEPKPYHYGLVGRASSHPSRGGSPPPPSPHSRSTSTPTIVNTGVVVQNVASAAAGASPTAALTGRRMSASSNANLNLAVPTDQQVSLRKRSPTPSQSLHSQSPSFSQSTRTPSRTSHLSMNPTGALIVASSSGATGAALGSTQRLRVTPSPTFPGASSIPPAAISPGLTPRSNHPSYSSSRPSMSRLSATSSIAGPSQLQPQPSPGSQSPRPPSQQQQRPFPAQSPPPPYQDLPSQQSSPPQLSEPERGIPDPRILQQQQLAMLPPGAGPPMMRQSWPRYLSNDGASGEGETAPRREDYDEFGRYLVGTSGNGFREGRTASEGRPYSGIPTRTVSALAASVEMVKGLGRSAMASGSGGGPSQEGKRRAATTSMAFSTSTSTSISSPPPSTPAFPRTSGSKSLLDIQIPSSSMDFGSAVLDQPSGEVGDVQDVDGKEKGKGRADEDPTNEDHAGNEGDERPTSRLKRSSTVDSEVIRALAMERLSGGRQNVLYVVNREASLEGGEEGGAGGQPP